MHSLLSGNWTTSAVMADLPPERAADSVPKMAPPAEKPMNDNPSPTTTSSSLNTSSSSSTVPDLPNPTQLVEPTSYTSSTAPANQESEASANQLHATERPFEFTPPSEGKKELNDEQPIEVRLIGVFASPIFEIYLRKKVNKIG